MPACCGVFACVSFALSGCLANGMIWTVFLFIVCVDWNKRVEHLKYHTSSTRWIPFTFRLFFKLAEYTETGVLIEFNWRKSIGAAINCEY